MRSESLSRLKGIKTVDVDVNTTRHHQRSSESLSRLKGIKTSPMASPFMLVTFVQKAFPVWRELKPKRKCVIWVTPFVQKAFPVWRELKPNTNPNESEVNPTRSESLSRLKGIKTNNSERWNPLRVEVQKAFPVWRELKLRTRKEKPLLDWVQKAFPVWRELKLFSPFDSLNMPNLFRKPFPFEGN